MPTYTRQCGKIKPHGAHGTCGGLTEQEYNTEDYVMVTTAINVKRNRRVVHTYGPYTRTRAMAEKRSSEARFKMDQHGPDWELIINVCHLLKPEDWRPDGEDPEIQGDVGAESAQE